MQKDTKNKSKKEFIVKTIEFDFSKNKRDPVGDFPKEQKSGTYNKNNSSVVNMLPSHNAMELNKGTEKAEFPCTKAGREMKMAANQSNVFSHKNKYNSVKNLSQDFECYREKPETYRNQNNPVVEAARQAMKTSKIF